MDTLIYETHSLFENFAGNKHSTLKGNTEKKSVTNVGEYPLIDTSCRLLLK